MKFSCELFFLSVVVLVQTSSAQDLTKYFEVGKKLTLETNVSAITKPITSIRWKYGTSLVVDWTSPDHLMYFGSFSGRTTLDPQTLRLDIDRVTLADSGSFSLETNSGTYETYNVEVIKPPPTPSIKTQPLVCEDGCDLKCTADTKYLGPVTYQWKMDEGEWTEGKELKSISISDTTEKFFCRLKTPVSTSENSPSVDNPFNKPVPDSLHPGIITVISIGVIVGAVIAVIAMLKYCNPFCTLLKKTLPCVKQQDNSRKDTNANKADQTNTAAESLPLSSAAESHSLQPSDSIVFETGSKD